MESGNSRFFYFCLMPILTGYAGTPLAKKSGIKEAAVISVYNAPDYYLSLFTDWPANVMISTKRLEKKNLIHFFTKREKELAAALPSLKEEVFPNGSLWVSWPRKAANIPTDITEDVIRKLGLANGLVDVKVCAVDAVWSGLKLVIPVKDRIKL